FDFCVRDGAGKGVGLEKGGQKWLYSAAGGAPRRGPEGEKGIVGGGGEEKEGGEVRWRANARRKARMVSLG
ncbi:MAG: hypothetical protein L6R39_004514, partial [Caloplaca ligustica]